MLLAASMWALVQAADSTALGEPAACVPLADEAEIPNPIHLDFDSLPAGTVLGTLYQADYGVVFEDNRLSQAIVQDPADGLAHSPPNVVYSAPVASDSRNVPMVIMFDLPQTHAGMYIGNGGDPPPTAILRALADDGTELCSTSVENVALPHELFIGLYDPQQRIASVAVDYGDVTDAESIDDLYFVAHGPAPTPTTTSSPSPTATRTNTATPTQSLTPTPTPSVSTTPTPTPPPSRTPTLTPPPSRTPTRTPSPTSTPSITPLPSATPTITPSPTKTATPQPPTDLVIDGMEITQGIQDLDNSVPLVAGKRTFVRLYGRSTSGQYVTFARLRVERTVFGQTFTKVLYPIYPGGPFVTMRQSYLRLLPHHAFLFELPAGFREGTIKLTAELNPIEAPWRPLHLPTETNYGNNTSVMTVSFASMDPLPVAIVSFPYQDNLGTTYAPSGLDIFNLIQWLDNAYPVNKLAVYLRTGQLLTASRKWVPDATGTGGSWDMTYPTCNSINTILFFSRNYLGGQWAFSNNTSLYGMVSDEFAFMRGCAFSFNSSGPAGDGSFGWDFDGTYADWYGGHEIAHSYGLAHTLGTLPSGCGEKGAVKQHPNGLISPTANLFADEAMYGFDPSRLGSGNPIYGPNWHDVMTYCSYQWPSDITYRMLLLIFQILGLGGQASAGPSALESPVARLAVYGSIQMPGYETWTLPLVVRPDAEDSEPRTPGPYAVVLRDGDGVELARYPFTPELGEAAGPAPIASQEPQTYYISELVPYVVGTAQVVIEGPGGSVLSSVTAGVSAPQVEVLSPDGGEVIAAGPVPVFWAASDPDGDPLTFNAYYSADAGQTWEALAVGIEGTQMTLDFDSLPSSSQALIRLEATDGIHSAFDDSDAFFSVSNHPPSVWITQPEQDVTVVVSQTVALSAMAYDPDLGLLQSDELAWTSTLDGLLGTGAQLSLADLSAGEHIVIVTADDGAGGMATDSINVTVLETPLDLTPVANRLLVAPDRLDIHSGGQVVTITVGVDNANPVQSVTWQVAASQPWIVPGAAAGVTPAAVTFMVTPASLETGEHWSDLVFTSPELPGMEATVRVRLTLSWPRIYLPASIR
jgi:hypothetical protein